MTAIQDFESLMGSLYERTGAATGYWPSDFRREVQKRGGVTVAKRLLDPKCSVSAGFDNLADAHRADLSVEALAVQRQFKDLFTLDEIQEAQRRLDRLPAGAFPRSVAPNEVSADELTQGDEEYTEGAKRRITVNAYERSRSARDACIRQHGCECAVCGLDFEKRYGPIGEGFIHVHHTRPLALAKKGYRLNPKTHLVPVCPNCHAMLHSRVPPMDVEELRRIVRKSTGARIIYSLPDEGVVKKCYNKHQFFGEIDWKDWPAAIGGFEARFEKWYFDHMLGGHASYLDFCALCALVEVFSYYESDKDWHDSKNYKEFLRKLDPVFRKSLSAPIVITRSEAGSWTEGKLRDIADVFYAGVRCSLHHHGDLASFAAMHVEHGEKKAGKLADVRDSAGQSLCGSYDYSLVVFNPGELKSRLRKWFHDYCNNLRGSPLSPRAERFRTPRRQRLRAPGRHRARCRHVPWQSVGRPPSDGLCGAPEASLRAPNGRDGSPVRPSRETRRKSPRAFPETKGGLVS